MRRANVVSGMLLSLFGLVILFGVIPWQIDSGPADMMSPRLVPQIMMTIVVALAVLLTVLNRRSRHEGGDATPSPFSWDEMRALLKIGGVFAVSLLLFEYASPLLAGLALVFGALFALGERRPVVLVLMPAGFLLALWILFYKLLGTAIM